MSTILTMPAKRANASLLQRNIDVRHSVLLEILAALLGYPTYCAFGQEERGMDVQHHVGEAEFLILNCKLASARAKALCDLSIEVVDACVDALMHSMTIPVFRGPDAFYAKLGIEAVAVTLDSIDLKALLGSNWDANKALIINRKFIYSESPWAALTTWNVLGHAVWDSEAGTMRKDIGVDVRLTYAKAGRAGFIYQQGALEKPSRCKEIEVSLETTRLDYDRVLNGDGSFGRPWLALTVDATSKAVLGFSVSSSDDLDGLMTSLLTKSSGGRIFNSGGVQFKGCKYRITKIHTDISNRATMLDKTANSAGLFVKYTSPQHGNNFERFYGLYSAQLRCLSVGPLTEAFPIEPTTCQPINKNKLKKTIQRVITKYNACKGRDGKSPLERWWEES